MLGSTRKKPLPKEYLKEARVSVPYQVVPPHSLHHVSYALISIMRSEPKLSEASANCTPRDQKPTEGRMNSIHLSSCWERRTMIVEMIGMPQ